MRLSHCGQLRNSLPPARMAEHDPRMRTAMAELRFDVFGKLIAVAKTSAGWTTYLLGQDGKRTAADIVVPAFIEEGEVGQYLADLLHELATPTNNRVVRLPPK